ncbi:error-prone DNA polymerase [Rhodocyclaceae bacterium SMB388]
MYSPQNTLPYAELHCLSNFSFQRGASHPEELVAQAAALGYAALAITDECSFAGVVRAHQEIRRQSLALELIIGTEIRLTDGPTVVLLAMNREGYGALSRLISFGRRQAGKGQYRLCRADIEAGLPDCIALLVAPEHDDFDDASLLADAIWLGHCFPARAWLAVSLHCGPDDHARQTRLTDLATRAGLPALAATGALMHDAGRRRLADVLAATRLRTTVAEAGLRLAPNAERCLHPRDTLARRHAPALLAETLRVAGQCRFSLDELRYAYPDEIVPDGHSAASWLRHLVEDGLRWRYGSPDPDAVPVRVRAQIEHELALIAELGYEPYFLTVHDIVRFARSRDILCQGRGSAANSVVCWALGITEVDPELGIMLVERFISRERNEPPDIDVDFEHDRREEVIQYIYDRYGRERAALAATVIRYRPRSALRDVGRALGFPLARIERLTRDHFWFDGRHILPERIREAGMDPDAPTVRLLVELTHALIGFPRHLSQHVGGFVIARGRLDELVPIENAAMADRTVIQWDKDDLDAVGLLKIDVLALGMLSALRRSLELVSRWRNWRFTLADIPREVPAVYRMLSEADSVGVFQVESRAQMTMLPRLKPRRFYDLVVEVAIVRPGPIQGGMVHPYLDARARAERGEAIDYPRPAASAPDECSGVQAVLERTLGVPIFQEQVMQLAVVAAGFTPGEADQLRRSMGAWRRKGELERHRARLLAGMAERGYCEAFAERLCNQIEGFGSYGFPESHAASFALLVYFSAWLKRFEPAAFLCGLLNSQPMGFYSPSQLIQDARRHNVEIRGPDVCASDWDCTLEAATGGVVRAGHANGALPFSPSPEPAARLGLRLVKGLARETAERLVAARQSGSFRSVDDLAARAGIDPPDMKKLAAAGALAGLAGNRRQALWLAAGSRPADGVLQGAPITESPASLVAPSEAEDLTADYARLGFTLGRHPLNLLRSRLAGMRFLSATDIAGCADRQLARAAGIVTCRQRPGTARGTMFVTLEDETGLINIIVRPELIERQRREVLGARLLGVYGQISRQGSVVHLQAGRVVDLSGLLGELDARSRDFH